MATNTAPLLSFSARGSIAKTQVYASWKGRPYVRRHVVPANPRSTEQTKTRSVFAWLAEVWKLSPADFQTAWVAYAKGKVLTDRNAFMGQNIRVLRPIATMTGYILSPGAAGGLVGTIVPTPSAGQISIAGTPPSPLPTGWSVVKLIGAAIADQNPHVGTIFNTEVASDDTTPYAAVISGLAAGDYWCGGWFVYQRSALATDLAYGPSVAVKVTVT